MRFLTDINFRGAVLRGLRRQAPMLDVVRAQDVGLDGVSDEDLLTWAAENDRILFTHDRSTIPPFAWQRVAAGEAMPGVIVVDRRLGIGQAITELLIIATCSEPGEWKDRVEFLRP